RVAQLPAVGTGCGYELGFHAEAAFPLVPPPSGQTRPLRARVARVDKAAADRAGAGVHVLVVAPDREIGAAVVQPQWQVADGMGEIEADHGAGRVAQADDFRQVEGLPGAV